MKICDAHLHYANIHSVKKIAENSILRETFPCYQSIQYNSMQRYEELFLKYNIEKTVLVPFVLREQNAIEESKLVLDYAMKDTVRYFAYMYLDESNPEYLEKNYMNYVGVKEHLVRHESILTKEKSIVFEIMNQHKMILLLHSQQSRRIEYVRSLLRNFPNIVIQIAHMGRGAMGDTEMIYKVLKEFAKDENVIFDTSTIRDPEVIGKAVDMIGTDRILYGSDLPFFIEDKDEDIMFRQIQQILKAKITDDARENIFYNNFQKWIRRGV